MSPEEEKQFWEDIAKIQAREISTAISNVMTSFYRTISARGPIVIEGDVTQGNLLELENILRGGQE